jgi:anti-sigma regulatory factor (Ser/Thr protein kinase)
LTESRAEHLAGADVIAESPTVRLDLESRPQTLTIVRGMLSGVAESMSIDAELLDDLKTAVSEACNNVVLHAYDGGVGPMGVRLYVDRERMLVSVRDYGSGMPAAVLSGERSDGIGVSVIRALADELTLTSDPGAGTEVQIAFAARERGWSLPDGADAPAPDTAWNREEPGEVLVSLTPVGLLTGVLGRLARTLAATAHFSLDRFSDVYLVTDTLAAHAASAAAGSRISARMSADERRLELSVGPFRSGTGAQLQSPPAGRSPSPLMLLSDEVAVEPVEGGELLKVVVIDRRPQ